MGAHGGLRESKVVCLRNMVGAEEVDEALQEEIEEECSKYGEVDNVIIYQVGDGGRLNSFRNKVKFFEDCWLFLS